VGNAAQALHPVAGQGLNLGLRDAWELAREVRSAIDAGDPALLQAYASHRRLDAFATIRVTDALARLFLGTNRFAGTARGLAMLALDSLAPARRFFARRMVFGASALP
jgi:2-octaprenyl-6-methoxyphenol hydroxylase